MLKDILLVIFWIFISILALNLVLILVGKLIIWLKSDRTKPHGTQETDNETYEQRMKRKALENRESLNKLSSHKALLAVYIGGTNIRAVEGATVYLSTIGNSFAIRHAIANEGSDILLNEITTVEIAGPGTQTTNAGLIGGGFGLEGAAKGILAAALVNAATTKTTTNTFLRVATSNSEALFHFNDQEPSKLRLILSHLFVAAAANNAPKAVSTNSISEELTKLQSLKEAGVLSEEEFFNAKQKLLT